MKYPNEKFCLCFYKSFKLFLFISVLFTFSTLAYARNYYVDCISGDDGNDGTSIAPWRTIDRAKGSNKGNPNVDPGDTVYFRAGTYRISSVLFDHADGGTIGNPITYSAYNNETPIFDFQYASIGFNIYSDYIILDGLNMMSAGELISIKGDNITIQKCDIKDSNSFAGISVGGRNVALGVAYKATTIRILNNKLYDGLWRVSGTHETHGIYANDAKNLIIRGNEFYNNDGNGIQIQPRVSASDVRSAEDVYIENNKFHNNGLSGIRIGRQDGDPVISNINIINNILWDNSENGIKIDTLVHADIKLYHNTLYMNSSGIRIVGDPTLDLKNNIMYGNSHGIKFASYNVDLAKIEILRNIYGNMTSSHLNIDSFRDQAKSYNKVAIDPGFVSTDSAKPDFIKIKSTSAARDYGEDLGIITDFFGGVKTDGKHDIGAHEHGSVVDTTPPSPPTGLLAS